MAGNGDPALQSLWDTCAKRYTPYTEEFSRRVHFLQEEFLNSISTYLWKLNVFSTIIFDIQDEIGVRTPPTSIKRDN